MQYNVYSFERWTQFGYGLLDFEPKTKLGSIDLDFDIEDILDESPGGFLESLNRSGFIKGEELDIDVEEFYDRLGFEYRNGILTSYFPKYGEQGKGICFIRQE